MADQVSIICKRTVISIKPVEPRKFVPLSVLDRIMENNHLRLVLYYNFPTRRRPGEVTKKLRESISEMLDAFPIVTGRLLRAPNGHWMIKCNDAGLRMVEARVKGSVEDWLQNVDREKELMLVHWEEMFHKPYFWSTFYVQITEFENGGLAIGLSCAHLLSDPISSTMVIKAWADMTMRGEIGTPPLFLPLPSPRQGNKNTKSHPYFHLIDHYKSAVEESAPKTDKKQTTLIFHFNQEKVRRCIAMAETPNKREHGTSPTPFEALIALFWTRVSKAKEVKTGLVDMSLCLDMRKVLGLEKSFFGNCMVYQRVHGDLEADENKLAKAAALIKETATRIDGEEVVDLIEWLESGSCKNPPLMNGCNLICVNLENVELYSVAFEENGSPLRASYYIEPAIGPGQVVVLPSPGGGESYGRLVAVTLPEDEAEKLLEDSFIQQLDPNIVMGLNKVS